ncbi:LPS export ABC transporter permease LptG [Polynucleobacter sp. 30F-ANTBAC]|jgi:lipopolysaccharide export system permease protein|uniref:LPS export ABC transporter permease LptG n=1 Tax=Polynucleobacter sp. 30F-ANTBAC TaxID=2689095 RepID=UPI001C0A9C1E|nr:LPS export ABC transporter permease LptG [Polynucleobacter sp. 30F-ANTBAC]MBU3599549.1 LPS export ABC transporter permease LptG [Polynucleobacter sp. 30F-ANTBAC]
MWHKLFPLVYERYLAKQIYLAFIFILFALMSLFIFFDFIAEMGDLGGSYTVLWAFLTVLLRVPSRLVEIIPIAGLIGGIYVMASMAAQSEYTILRVAGLDTGKALATLMKIAFPIALLILLMSEVVGPFTEGLSKNVRLAAINQGKEVLEFRSGAWIKDKLRGNDGKGAIQDGIRYINVGSLEKNETIKGFRMYEFDANHRLLITRTAETVQFIGNGQWQLNKVTETRFSELTNSDRLEPSFSTQIKKSDQLEIETEVSPQLLGALLIKPDRLSIIDLFSYINHLKENKQDYQRYAISFWKKVIYPFTILVMLALALPFAYLQTRSGGIGYKVFGGIMLGISFQLFNSLFSHAGLLGEWPALLSASIPALLYFILAIFGIRWVSKV